jgi:hypothetical protein
MRTIISILDRPAAVSGKLLNHGAHTLRSKADRTRHFQLQKLRVVA